MSRVLIRCVSACVAVMVAILLCPQLYAEEFISVHPAVADKTGLYGSYWQTDMVFQPVGCGEPETPVGFPWCAVPVVLEFYPFGQDGPLVFTADAGYIPRAGFSPPSITVENVLKLIPGASGHSGALVIRSPVEFRAFVRSYNIGEEGTFGHWVPDFNPLVNGEYYRIPYAVGRVNLMIVNLGDAGTIKIRGETFFVPADGAKAFVDIHPSSVIVAGLPLNPPVVGFDGEPLIYAIATTIDNETNDATTVPLWPLAILDEVG